MNITEFTEETSEYQVIPKKHPWQGKCFMASGIEGEATNMPSSDAHKSICNAANRGRVAIFIDGSNLFHAALQLGIEIDYTKLLCCLTRDARLLRAFFYTGIDRNNEKQQGFLLWMRRNGYRVVSKDLVQLPDGSKKANLDVEIAVDMMNLAPYYDTGVLVSGDGDLAYAVNAVAYQGSRIEVVSLRSMTSESLINVADCFIDLDSMKKNIQKDHNCSFNYR
ncbi:MAG: NYN domain-containing protein [Nostocaceae cyanobacterium]|nr:NYN domain-containing protein [Nostocaceae cyanobacterium]